MSTLARSILMASAIAIAPGFAFAQTSTTNQTGHSGGLVAPETYPHGDQARHDPALTERPVKNAANLPAAENPRVPGATGTTVVPGDNSTIASNRHGTIEQKTIPSTEGAGGSGGSD